MPTRYYFKDSTGKERMVEVDDGSLQDRFFVGSVPQTPEIKKTPQGLVAKVRESPKLGDKLLFIPVEDETRIKRLNRSAVLIPSDYVAEFNERRKLYPPVYRIEKI